MFRRKKKAIDFLLPMLDKFGINSVIKFRTNIGQWQIHFPWKQRNVDLAWFDNYLRRHMSGYGFIGLSADPHHCMVHFRYGPPSEIVSRIRYLWDSL